MNQPHVPGQPPLRAPPPSGYPNEYEKLLLRPRRPGRGLLVTASVLAVLAAVLAYYTLQLWQSQAEAQRELKTTQRTVTELRTERDKTHARDEQRDKRLAELNEELASTKVALTNAEQKLDELAEKRADALKNMREFREMAARFKRMIDSGRLKITIRRGRMVVDLPAQVLFDSGSAELSAEGKKALREVARILRKVRGKRFIVGGHTDNVKINKRKSPYSSNWALSAARAVTVTETLIRSGLRPAHLVAAGYGPYDPVARNSSEAGRQDNRRIEIILEPKLRELPERLEKKL